jgi:hypothetical protein
MYGTIHHHTNEKQSTNKSVPAKWLESGQMCFAMPARNDIFPCVKDKDIQPNTLYQAMLARIDIDILLTRANNQRGTLPAGTAFCLEDAYCTLLVSR